MIYKLFFLRSQIDDREQRRRWPVSIKMMCKSGDFSVPNLRVNQYFLRSLILPITTNISFMRLLPRIAAFLFFVFIIFATAVYLNRQQLYDDSQLGFILLDAKANNLHPMISNGIVILVGIVFGYFYTRFTEHLNNNLMRNRFEVK